MFQLEKKRILIAIAGLIAFGGIAVAQPAISFLPTDGATNISITTNIIINFDQAVRNIDNTEITSGNVATLLTLKKDDNFGEAVTFTASINAGKTTITIDPTSPLDNNQLYYVAIAPIEDAADNASPVTAITFTTTSDTQPPVPTFNPSNGTVDFPNASPIVITFDEPVRDLTNADLNSTSIDAKIVLKATNAAGPDIGFDATINGANTQVTITPSVALPDFTVIYVAVNDVEDQFDNAITVAESITFTTGDGTPPIISFSPADGATGVAVNTNITIAFDEALSRLLHSSMSR